MQKLLTLSLVLLFLGAARLPAQSRFVTESSEQLGIYDALVFWPSQVSQEFAYSFGQLDFISILLEFSQSDVQIIIHEGTLTGSVVAVSSDKFVIPEAPQLTTFTFLEPVMLLPGTLYVMEVALQDFGALGLIPDAYSKGRMLVDGVPYPGYALIFSAGVFIPALLPTQPSITHVMEGQSVVLFPEATLTNSYITNYQGVTLAVSLGAETFPEDTFELLNYDPAFYSLNDPYAGFLVFNNEIIGTVSRGLVTRDLTINFNSRATAATVQQTIRNITFRSGSSNPTTANRNVSLVFAHPSGATVVSSVLQIIPVNDTPLAGPVVEITGRAFPHALPGGVQFPAIPAIIARRGEIVPVVLDGSQSYDLDSTTLDYEWTDGTNLLRNQGKRVTNNFSLGFHLLFLTVRDEQGLTGTTYIGFEVLTAQAALKIILGSIDELDVPTQTQRSLRSPLRQAATALTQQRTGLTKRLLKKFQDRISQALDSDDLRYMTRNYLDASQTIIDGIHP